MMKGKAGRSKTGKNAKTKKFSKYREPSKCRFCRSKVEFIDYKDVATLQKLTTAQGKLFSRKRSGNCAKHQRLVRTAVKQSRHMALLPYVG